MSERIIQLDAIRGLAALSVVLHHCILALPGITNFPALSILLVTTPLHLFFAGQPAVLLFFVLSGFVLALPYFEGKPVKYTDYLIRRICRIYLPYLASVLISIACMTCFYRGSVADTSGWFAWIWALPASQNLVLDHLTLLKSFDNARLVPVFWSLVVEMRVSLIFPLLTIAVKVFDWPICLLSAVLFNRNPMWWQQTFPSFAGTDYLSSLQYTYYFLLGAFIAKYRRQATDLIANRMGNRLRWSLVVLFVFLYTLKFWKFTQTAYLQEFSDVAAGLAAGLIICLALGWSSFKKLLCQPYLQFLGRTSYSLYLFHTIVLFSVIHTLHGLVPVRLLAVLSFFLSVPIGWVAYRLFEKPSIALGRRLTTRNQPQAEPAL